MKLSVTTIERTTVADTRPAALLDRPDIDNEHTHSTTTWIARALPVAIACALAWYTWGHWGDFQIDNGREIYVPSAILHGKLRKTVKKFSDTQNPAETSHTSRRCK